MTGNGPKIIKLLSTAPSDSTGAEVRRRRICYVDDSRTSAYVTKRILTDFGFEVDHYSSAEPAVVALLENDYDLLLTDLLLSTGGMDGDDLVRFLRMSGHPKKKLLPVIVITGSSDKDTLLKIYEAGANGVLVKPITGDELNERIRSLLPDKNIAPRAPEYAIEIRDPVAPPAAKKVVARSKPPKTQVTTDNLMPAPEPARAAPPPAVPAKTLVVPAGVGEPTLYLSMDVVATPTRPIHPGPPLKVGKKHRPAPSVEMEAAGSKAVPPQRPVHAFGAKKKTPAVESTTKRDAAAVIAELRAQAQARPAEEEEIPTLTLAVAEEDLRAALVGAAPKPKSKAQAEPARATPSPLPEQFARSEPSPELTLFGTDSTAKSVAEPIKPAPPSKPPRAEKPDVPAKKPIDPSKLDLSVFGVDTSSTPGGGKAIVTALDIEANFQDIQDDVYQPTLTQTVVETIKRYKLLSTAAVVSLVIIVWSIFNFMHKGAVVNVDTVVAEEGALRQTVSVPGKVVGKLKVDLSAATAGQVRSVAVKEGDKVRKGQVLVQMESGGVVAEGRQSDTALASAQEELAAADKNVIRMRRAVELGAVSRQALEEAETAQKGAQAHLNAAKEAMRLNKSQLDKMSIVSPIDGSVTVRSVRAGQAVRPGDVLLSVADLSQREIEVKVDAADSTSLNVGQAVEVSSDAFPGKKWSESVTRIVPIAARDNTAASSNVYISVGHDAPTMKLGQQVEAEIRVASNDRAVKLPLSALNTRNGKSWVAVIDQGRVHYVPVTTGMEDMTHVQITQGVKPGQEVILAKGGTLHEGDRVRVLTPNE